MGLVPNAEYNLLCSLNENSLVCLYCSTETPFTNAFPTALGDTISMTLMYLHAVLDLFQKARFMMEKRSSPLKTLVIAPLKRKEGIEKSAFSPAARAWFSERASSPQPTWAPYREWLLLPPRRERCSGIRIPRSYPSPWLILRR